MSLGAKRVELTERRKKILGAVVDRYVRTAQPVGSKAIVREYRLKVSPATVRLEFAALEQMGLVFQPHTSAGRVPSDNGYRVFIEEVLIPRPLPPYRLQAFERRLTRRYGEVREVLQTACALLSRSTNYAAWVILPRQETEVVRGIHFSPLPDKRVVVMVLGHRLIHKPFRVSETFSPAQWQRVANWLSVQLYGIPFARIQNLSWRPSQRPSLLPDTLCELAFHLVQGLIETTWEAEVWLEGLSKVLMEPEFQDVKRAKKLVTFWESPKKLVSLCQGFVEKVIPSELKAWVSIGAENPFEELHECSLVGAPYFAQDIPLGFVGILGPKRMRYGDVISTVEGFANILSQTLTSLLS